MTYLGTNNREHLFPNSFFSYNQKLQTDSTVGYRSLISVGKTEISAISLVLKKNVILLE